MIYRFGDFKLQPADFSLRKVEEPIELEPQVFNLILFLIENRERVVTREQIFAKLWGNKEVLDASLSNHIKSARAALGDDGKSQSIIRTVRGRGYQFVARVSTVDSTERQQTQQRTLSSRKRILYPLSIIALVAVVSWFYKQNSERQSLVESVANIAELQRVTYTAFIAQIERRDELVEMINSRLNTKREMQFEKYFSYYYPQLNSQELFVFQQIRSITESGLYKNNLSILSELSSNPRIFDEIELTRELQQHLIFWVNKYESVFVNREYMCLLYVGVEDGVPYPAEVNQNIKKWLTNSRIE